MKITTLCCCVATLLIIAGCSVKEPPATTQSNSTSAAEGYVPDIQISDLVGDWMVGAGVAKVVGSDVAALTFTTEVGLKGAGAIHGDTIEVSEWKVSGKLTLDRKHIRWSNGLSWDR